MEILKKHRNIGLCAGILLLINFILQLVNKGVNIAGILNLISSIYFFYEAYTKQKKIIQYKNNNN